MEEKTLVVTNTEATEAINTAEETPAINTVDEAVETTAEAIEEVVDEKTESEAIKLNSLNSLKYLISEIYSHSYLLNKATGANIFIDERMKNDLAEAVTFEEGLALFSEVNGMELIKGIEARGDSLRITAFDAIEDSAMQKAVRMLLTFLEKSVKEKNVNLHKVEVKRPENEKFCFRTWLIRLGWKGIEGKVERNLLYKKLAGNTAFCTEESKARWEEKHKTGKRIEHTVHEDVSMAEETKEAKETVA